MNEATLFIRADSINELFERTIRVYKAIIETTNNYEVKCEMRDRMRILENLKESIDLLPHGTCAEWKILEK